MGDGNGVNLDAAIYKVSKLSIGHVDFLDSSIVSIPLDEYKSALGVEHVMILGFNHMLGKIWAFDFEHCRYAVT